MRGRALLLGAAALVTGCSLIYAGDLDDAREIVIRPDGGDSGAADTGASEADAKDGQSGEAAAPTGCAAIVPAPKFCDDFDNDAGLDGWKADFDIGQGELSTEQFVSTPRSLKITMPAVSQGCQYSRYNRDFENIGTNRVTLTLRLRLAGPWADDMIPVVLDLLPKGSDDYCAALYFVGAKDGKVTSARLDVQSKTVPDHVFELDGYPSEGEWAQMKVVVTPRAGGGRTYETTFTDPNGFSLTTKNDFPECPAWTNLGLHLGPHCDHRDGTIYYDDVQLDWE